jgi:hypothetical protein
VVRYVFIISKVGGEFLTVNNSWQCLFNKFVFIKAISDSSSFHYCMSQFLYLLRLNEQFFLNQNVVLQESRYTY